jgi:hypothetical protein
MINVLGLFPINIIKDKVSIILGGSGKDDDLIELAHVLEELYAAGSELKLLLLGDEVHEGLVQVKHQSVCSLCLLFWQQVVHPLEINDVLPLQIVLVLGLPQDLLCSLLRPVGGIHIRARHLLDLCYLDLLDLRNLET